MQSWWCFVAKVAILESVYFGQIIPGQQTGYIFQILNMFQTRFWWGCLTNCVGIIQFTLNQVYFRYILLVTNKLCFIIINYLTDHISKKSLKQSLACTALLKLGKG